MLKRTFVVLFFLVLTFSLLGCEEMGSSDYLLWRNSSNAEDLNGDRKIDEADYELYLNSEEVDYETWRASEDAYDYNEDAKIDETDYQLYLLDQDYQAWFNSDDAEDLNGDRKIDELDYAIFLEGPLSEFDIWADSEDALDMDDDGDIDETDYDLFLEEPLSAYEIWRNSDDAEDFNADRKIDELDYAIFLEGPQSEFDIWADSEDAEDIDDDGDIDEDDYDLFIARGEFTGTYTIENYVYTGHSFYVGEDLYLKDFGPHLNQIIFTVDENGNVDANIPSETIAAMGTDFAPAVEGLSNMTLTRISNYIVSLDTFVTVDGVELNVTIYLVENATGYSASYIINYAGKTATVSFDLVIGD